ncbi:hypothetical protein PRZ61_15785 [Halomonas pacifica]|uniref:Uncharacterized protein n=1 Tax=Bisbaumannia pacifica TaxID=77098 RepID=A0A510XGF1_9GAMM|nr:MULTISPECIES: hypothetical protein [Halomonas]MBH8581713.1 hypothetical protein [Halomonas pacifica]MDC8804914.1 hypothetical protein [Halomonas pacifica]GEK48030.1 hypothetical protein HPA02_23130 [Halomonas pacifica]GKW50724.1 hypothetical protein NCCP2165_29390 [Halomonas sp. NCCP-2165]
MAIRYNLWLDPDNTATHRAVEADLERYFVERFADYPHIRLFGADPYDYDAPFNRLYDALMARALDYCERQWCYVPTPAQLNQAFFRAVGRSNKFLRDPQDGDPHRSDSR